MKKRDGDIEMDENERANQTAESRKINQKLNLTRYDMELSRMRAQITMHRIYQ